jgi:AAA domain
MKYELKPASKKQGRLRMAIYGISKSGKTLTSLLIASGISEKIGLIDTHGGQSHLCSDYLPFTVLEITEFSSSSYYSAIKYMESQNFPFLIIDGLSDEYLWMLESVDKMNMKDPRKAWGSLNPSHEKMLNAIKQYNGHVIVTMRGKLHEITEENERGQKIKKECMGFVQKAGLEYAFDFMLQIDEKNIGHMWGARGKFKDMVIEKPGKDFGKELIDWLNDGEPLKLATQEQIQRFDGLCSMLKLPAEKVKEKIESKGFYSKETVTEPAMNTFIDSLEEALKKITHVKTMQQQTTPSQDVL